MPVSSVATLPQITRDRRRHIVSAVILAIATRRSAPITRALGGAAARGHVSPPRSPLLSSQSQSASFGGHPSSGGAEAFCAEPSRFGLRAGVLCDSLQASRRRLVARPPHADLLARQGPSASAAGPWRAWEPLPGPLRHISFARQGPYGCLTWPYNALRCPGGRKPVVLQLSI